MLNIVKSELYKTIHRKCTYVFFIVFGVGGFFFNLLLKVLMKGEFTANPGDVVLDGWEQIVVAMGWYLVYMIAQTVHSNESKLCVLKNSISYGSNRTKIYIGRYIAQLIALVVSVAVVAGLVILGVQLFFGGVTAEGAKTYYEYIGIMMVMWVAAISMAHALAMNLNSNTLATVIYILYFSLTTDLLSILQFALPNNGVVKFLRDNEIRTFAINMLGEISDKWKQGMLIALVYLVVTFVLGIFLFRRKEVK